jgi:hypothetical protein
MGRHFAMVSFYSVFSHGCALQKAGIDGESARLRLWRSGDADTSGLIDKSALTMGKTGVWKL